MYFELTSSFFIPLIKSFTRADRVGFPLLLCSFQGKMWLSLQTLMLRSLSLLEYYSLRELEFHMPDLQNMRKCAQASIEKALHY